MSGLSVETERIRWRPSAEDDLEYVLSLERHPDNAPFIVQWPADKHLAAISDPDRAHLMVEATDTDQVIGYLILAALQSPHRRRLRQRVRVAGRPAIVAGCHES